MIPQTKARTRQREQGALKAEIATAMKLQMTRENSETASAESIWPERGGSPPYGGDRRMRAKSASCRRRSVNKKAEWADKPGSVVNGHLSCLHVTVQLHARYPNADRAGP